MLAASCLRHDTLRCFQDKVANLFQLFFKSNRGEVDIFYRELHSFFPCVLYDWRSIFGVCECEKLLLFHTGQDPILSSQSPPFPFSFSVPLLPSLLVPSFCVASIRLMLKPGLVSPCPRRETQEKKE